MKTIFGQLSSGATINLRKQSCNCIGAFAAILNATQLKVLCQELINLITKSQDKIHLATLVHCVSLVAKTVGNNLTPFLPQLVPILLKILTDVQRLALKEQSTQVLNVENELAEACLTTIQMMIKRCPGGLQQQTITDIFKNAVNLVCYDPNYIYQDDEADEEMKEDDGGWGDNSDFSEEQDVQDDDDTSWKVRRGGCRVI